MDSTDRSTSSQKQCIETLVTSTFEVWLGLCRKASAACPSDSQMAEQQASNGVRSPEREGVGCRSAPGGSDYAASREQRGMRASSSCMASRANAMS